MTHIVLSLVLRLGLVDLNLKLVGVLLTGTSLTVTPDLAAALAAALLVTVKSVVILL